jgi:transposase
MDDPHHQRGSGTAMNERLLMNTSSRKDRPVLPNGRHVVGIDIGQKFHAAAGVTTAGHDFGRIISFDNTRAGVDRLEQLVLKPLGEPSRILIGMEATGHYWMPLFFELQRRGYHAIVINPIQTRGQFRCRIRKTKTDKLDARSIARLVFKGEAAAARIPGESVIELRLLTRHRWRLTSLCGDLQRFSYSLIERIFPEYADVFCKPLLPTGCALITELGLAPHVLAGQPDQVSALIARASRNRVGPDTIRTLLTRASQSIGIGMAERVIVDQLRSVIALLDTIESQIGALDEELARRVAALGSPLFSLGIHAPLVATIHAESDPIADFRRPWQYAAYAGLDPSTCDSGNFKGSHAHISKRGSPYLRHALFLTASALYRRQRDLQRLYQRSRKAGHHHTDALCIVAHKLARIVWRLLTDNRPFRARAPKLALASGK